jgi:ELWxxDGT repeat protein
VVQRKVGLAIAAVFLLALVPARAERLVDIHAGAVERRPQFADFAGQAFFGFHEAATGWEPWVSDGTPGGTRLLLDIRPGPCSSAPRGFVGADGQLFFWLWSGESGRELWRTDGTAPGTRLVAGLAPDTNPEVNAGAVAVDSRLFFVSGGAPWVSDGTPGGTFRMDSPGPVYEVAAAGGLAYFVDWFSDQVVVHDGAGVAPVEILSFPAVVDELETHGDRMAIRCADEEAWLSDGTQAGTVSIGCCFGQGGRPFRSVGGDRIFFVAADGHPIRPEEEPHVWDAGGGARLLKDIRPNEGMGPLGSVARKFTAVGDRLFFTASDHDFVFVSPELWVSDGTETGTVKLTDGRPGSALDPLELTAVGDQLMFATYSGPTPSLWVSDGTEAGTRQVHDPDPLVPVFPRDLGAAGDRGFYISNTANGVRFFSSDGTESGTTELLSLEAGGASSEPGPFVEFRGALYFGAVHATPGFLSWDQTPERTLWRTDGTPDGTWAVGPEGALSAVAWGERLAVVLTDGLQYAIQLSDGTPAGVRGPLSSGFSVQPELVALGERLVYGADGDLEAWEPMSDWPRRFSAHRGGFVGPAVLGDRAFFRHSSDPGAVEISVTDGTDAGTVQLADLSPGVGQGDDVQLGVAAGAAWFAADGGGTGVEPWTSDGTPAGTQLVLDIHPAGDSLPRDFVELGGLVYFHADDGGNGRELWRTDGSPGGTVLAAEVVAGAGGDVSELIGSAGLLFLAADDGVSGRELWTSDGTPGGTQLLLDLAPGPQDSNPRDFVVTDDGIAFLANDGVNGLGLWTSDGTPGGTVLREAPAAGADCTTIEHLLPIGDEFIFAADDGETGLEPWVTGPLTLPPAPQDLIVNEAIPFLSTAFSLMHDPFWVFGAYPNAGGCGRTRLAADRRLPVDAVSLDAGLPIADAERPLILFELSEWCGCSSDPLEPPPAGALDVEATLLITKQAGEIVATSLPGSAGLPCP